MAMIFAVPLADTASAHGSVTDPASRNYGCWLRWGNDFQNPTMQQREPMCWQAWQDNNALTTPLGWNHLELVRETGRYAASDTYMINGLSKGSRTGRHVIYTIGKASHMDQTYYFCSDVNFT
ncbi:lytic polysaccharide monooxygenase [Nonomuraea sp. 10N515B]|uniref:lytic polysaccharide monooxygenase n=1 Tax=Nonomuraea sp. 10N515B TaxID=3457422 RepID=UPI003FCCFB1E